MSAAREMYRMYENCKLELGVYKRLYGELVAALAQNVQTQSVDGELQEKEIEEKVRADIEKQRIRHLLLQSVGELHLSGRVRNSLFAANIKNVADLVRHEESQMLKYRNFGRQSLQLLIQVLDERGLHFGMDVDRYLED